MAADRRSSEDIRDEPVTPPDRLFLQPQLDQVISWAIVFENEISVDSVKSELQNFLLMVNPKFCSLVVRDSGGREHWRRTEVDVDRHLIFIRRRLSDDPDEDAVNDYLASLSNSPPLSTDKPLWEIHILVAHKTAVLRVHHALGDGVYLMATLLSFCRRIDDPSQTPATISGVKTMSFMRRRWNVLRLVNIVWLTVIYVLEIVLRVLWRRDKMTAVSGGRGVELWPRKLATARFRLDDMKTVKRAVPNSTINDVLFGIISSGLSRYLDTRSSTNGFKEGDRVTGAEMVNLRQHDSSSLNNFHANPQYGNRFGMILLSVYYHKCRSNPLDSVKRAKAMIDKKKLSLEALFTYVASFLVTYFFGTKLTSTFVYRIFCNMTFTISNMVGSEEKITFSGNAVKYIRVTSSTLPHAITMHMVSYAGYADMQISVAKNMIPDPKVLAKCFEDTLLEMKKAATTTIVAAEMT
ncbi:wax ester synthase/diacylglycerol acyltransferase 11-like isoform X2 [Andrographis paniculata]|uniref:wax ester synthase/diacylglycerol acyltransferase 11-like isoform X2 n=1 Tax=Andrographis paniculata TaxID=175694 RepID=UPI0021E8FF4B|nr:wax ester synthase/diacylglycerol acyltransferase 11-like isoform X2 [Andrographis paniculata]